MGGIDLLCSIVSEAFSNEYNIKKLHLIPENIFKVILFFFLNI